MDSRKWTEGKPVGEQMTPADANTFGNLQQRLKGNMLANLYESKRERDIRVLSRLARLADQTARYGLELPANTESEDYFLHVLLSVIDEEFPVEFSDVLARATISREQECDLENALLIASARAVSDAAAIDGLNEMFNSIERLTARYGSPLREQLDKMPEEDRSEATTAIKIFDRSLAIRELAESLARLSLYESTSKAVLASVRQDQYEAPGDTSFSGATWTRWVKEGKVTPQQEKMTRVINVVNEKIPAVIAADLAKKSGIKQTEK